MRKDYLLSSKAITSLVLTKMPLLASTKIDVSHAKLFVVEFLTLAYEHKGNISQFLDDNLFINEPHIKQSITAFLEEIVDDISIYCPEILTIIQQHDKVQIGSYDNHLFVLSAR